MIITIDTANPLSETDRLALTALIDGSIAGATGVATGATEPPQRAESPAAPSEAAGDTSLALDEALLEEAITRGTALAKAKKGAAVREALNKIGAKKVTEITTNDDLRAFLAALPG